jgi:hypothetical protein
MRDEIDGRLWAEHGHQLSDGLHTLLTTIRGTFANIHRRRWDAPWRHSSRSHRPGQA